MKRHLKPDPTLKDEVYHVVALLRSWSYSTGQQSTSPRVDRYSGWKTALTLIHDLRS